MAWEAIAGQFAAGFGSALGSPGGPSNVTAKSDPVFDSSGWNVIFGDGNRLSTERTQREGANTFDQYVPYVIAAAGVLIVWRLTKR
jgi:hypothetical protein